MSQTRQIKILHVISGLRSGGAEKVLFKIIEKIGPEQHCVISLTGLGYYGSKLRDLGVEVIALDFNSLPKILKSLGLLLKHIVKFRPDIMQTWMYHADLLGGVIGKICGVKIIIWGVRGPYKAVVSPISTRVLVHFCAFLSGWVPTKIVSNSKYAIKSHSNIGYNKERFVHIPNGFECPPALQREQLIHFRSSIGVREDEFLIGMVARFDIYKGHPTLLDALSLVSYKGFKFKFVLAGEGVDENNHRLKDWISIKGLKSRCRLLGLRDDINLILSSLDLHVLSSLAESFPNVVGESMYVGTPVVATNVGDVSALVSNLGWLVPPSDPKRLAGAVIDALTAHNDVDAWQNRQRLCRLHIKEKFNHDRMVAAFSNLWNISVQ